MKITKVILLMGLISTIQVKADSNCMGAEGDHATAFGANIGVSSPESRSCLNPEVARLIGTKSLDMPAGMVLDKQGNAYIAGETKGFNDSYYGDIFLLKLKPNGDTDWMVTYGGKEDDGTHAVDENTEGNGASSMVAIDDNGDIYVAGRGKITGKIYAGIAMKFSASGEMLWNKHYRPEWKNMARGSAEFHAVEVVNGIVHIAGVNSGESQTLIYALDAETGKTITRIAMDPSPKSNDRLYSLAVDPSGKAVYVGGWAGSGPQGLLMKVDFIDNKYSVNWAKKIPVPRGTNFPSMAIDTGNLYVAVDIHGASTYSEIHKYETTQGKLQWVRRYNAGVTNANTKTHVVKLVGEKIILAGAIGLTGTKTHADSNGDGFFVLLDKEGNLEREHYFYTGTGPKSFDGVQDVEIHGDDLYLVGWHWGIASLGEWRTPSDYSSIIHEWTQADKRDYRAVKVEVTTDDLTTAEALKEGKELKEYTLDDEAGDYVYNEIFKKEMKQPGSMSMSFFVFKDYLK